MINKIACFLLVIFLSLHAQPENPPKALPDFVFYDLNRNFFTKENLIKGKPVIVFFFDPYCDHCQKQTKMITENANKFKNVQFVFVSTETYKALKEFYNNYLKGKNLNVFVVKDKDYQFDNYFSYSVAPRLFVYDENWNYVKDFKNEVHPDVILKYLQ